MTRDGIKRFICTEIFKVIFYRNHYDCCYPSACSVLDDKGYTGSRIWAALDGDFVCVGSHFPALIRKKARAIYGWIVPNSG